MSLVSTLLVTTLAAGGLATAIPARTSTGSFSLHQVRNHNYVPHGPSALAKAYRKYGVPLPDDLKAVLRTAGKRSTGSVVTTPAQYDVEYLTPVAIGTPAQVLNLDVDTGSGDLWVFCSETPKNEVDGQTIYNPSNSSTSNKVPGATWEIQYGDGSSSRGDVYADTVSAGGLSVASQGVECAQQVSEEFTQDTANDGLLGLAFSSINTVVPTPQKTFLDNAIPSLDSPVLTADLKAGEPGHYNFGFIDQSAYNGTITYVDVDDSNGFWEFTATGYSVGSGPLKSTSIDAIADTGTTLLLVPSAVVMAYYKQVKEAKYDVTQGGYVFPCNSTMPAFAFGVGGTTITVPGKYVNFAPATGSNCFGGIQSNAGIGFSIFGDVVLKAAFVVFDGGKNQLGWASKSLP